jgi:hypothetical protein
MVLGAVVCRMSAFHHDSWCIYTAFPYLPESAQHVELEQLSIRDFEPSQSAGSRYHDICRFVSPCHDCLPGRLASVCADPPVCLWRIGSSEDHRNG